MAALANIPPHSARTWRRLAAPALAAGLALAVAASLAIGRGPAAPAGAATQAASAAAAGPAKQAPLREIRLLTGDVVRLDASGQVLATQAGPRADGSRPSFHSRTFEGQTYVIPSDVAHLVGRQLDQALFNVTALAAYGLDRNSSLPVIVETAAPAQPGADADLSELGLEVTQVLETLPAQAGQADADTSQGPAASWALIDAVADDPAASPGPAAGADEPALAKIWLDRSVQVEPAEGGEADEELPLPASGTPAWMELIGVDQAKAADLDGAGVKVAVVDTGIDTSHPDLAGQVVAEADFTDLGSAHDEAGHGTFVASEIAGTGAASGGVYAGVAPKAALINARVLDGDGWGANSAIMAGIEWAAKDQQADIINLSLGDPGVYDDGSSFFDQFVNQVAQDYGCLIVVAAGNDSLPQTVSSPATADEVLSVGATDQDGDAAWFTSRGPRRGDGAVNPQVMAPGAGAKILDEAGDPIPVDSWGWPVEEWGGEPYGYDVGGMVGAQAGSQGYATTYTGTSMAAPLVAGAAALLLQADPAATRQDLRARLVASATALPGDSNVFEQGAGLVNLPAALGQTLTASPTELNLGGVEPPWSEPVTGALTYTNAGSQAVVLDLEAGLTASAHLGLPVTSPEEPQAAARQDGEDGEDGEDGAGGQDDAAVPPLSSEHIALTAASLTVPAGGSASVGVTVDPSAFATSYIGGYVTATDGAGAVLRTPIGLANQPQTHQLTITASGRDGQPLDPQQTLYVSVYDLIRGGFQDLALVGGEASAKVLAGSYMVLAQVVEVNQAGGLDALDLATLVAGLDGPTQVHLDGSQAQAVTAATAHPAQGVIEVEYGVEFEDPEHGPVGFWMRSGLLVDTVAENGLYLATGVQGAEAQWGASAAAALTQPYTEASLDACGTDRLPVLEVARGLPAGHLALEVADWADGEAPAGDGAGRAALLHLPDLDLWGESYAAAAEALDAQIAAAQAAGYRAAVIESNLPYMARELAAMALLFGGEEGEPARLPVLVTDQASGARLAELAAAGQGWLYLLSRDTPQYTYALSESFDLAEGGGIALAGDEASTAQVTVRHRAMGGAAAAADSFFAQDAISAWAEVYAASGASYTAYLSPGATWSLDSYLFDPSEALLVHAYSSVGAYITNYMTPGRQYEVGQPASVTLGSQVHGAGFDPVGWVGLERYGDTLQGGAPLFVDGQGQPEWVRGFEFFPDYGALSFTLTDQTTGETLFSNADDPAAYSFAVEGLDPAQHSYRLDATTTSETEFWAWSTLVTSSWQWDSAEPAPAEDGADGDGEDGADGDGDGDGEDDAEVYLAANEPVRQVWYELPGLDADNAGSPSQTIVLHVSQLPGSEPIPLESAALEASTDGGATWAPIALAAGAEAPADSVGAGEGEELYTGRIDAPAGAVVSLRSQVAGGGSSFDQTVLNAYPVTNAPRAFETAGPSWASCGIAEPLPIQVSSEVPEVFQAPGAAPNDTVTLSLADGAAWRADANGQPARVRLDGVFYGGSASRFALADEAPAGTPALGQASLELTLPTAGAEPVTVAAPAGFTVANSQYGVWVWRIDRAAQAPAVAPLIPAGAADRFGQAGETHVTQMALDIRAERAGASPAAAALAQGASSPQAAASSTVCSRVWLEPAQAGDLWLNGWDSGQPVKVAVTGALETAAQAGPGGQAPAGAKTAASYQLTFTQAGRAHAQTVCHPAASPAAGVYSFGFSLDAAGQEAASAAYLARGAVFAPWQAATTTRVAPAGPDQLPVSGTSGAVGLLVLALALALLGEALLVCSRWRRPARR
ncbi:MAG: S8 family serine peptidase [Bifidobacteriaceae bacterium]|nr:S8 family serine peptidase [Bifidobacteriaceae bacterium]